MLIISRKRQQKIVVADEIEITILEIGRNRVRFGIKAPKQVRVQTRQKDTPVPLDPAQPIETERTNVAFDRLPATVGIIRPK